MGTTPTFSHRDEMKSDDDFIRITAALGLRLIFLMACALYRPRYLLLFFGCAGFRRTQILAAMCMIRQRRRQNLR